MNDQPMTLEMLAAKLGVTNGALVLVGELLAKARRETKLSLTQIGVILLPEGDKLAGDGRVGRWAVRLRVYGPGDKLEADSDAELGPDDPGKDTVDGLPAVAAWIAELLGAFHGMPSSELVGGFERRLPSLRVALSRNEQKGARWAVAYDAPAEPGKTLSHAKFKAVATLTRVAS